MTILCVFLNMQLVYSDESIGSCEKLIINLLRPDPFVITKNYKNIVIEINKIDDLIRSHSSEKLILVENEIKKLTSEFQLKYTLNKKERPSKILLWLMNHRDERIKVIVKQAFLNSNINEKQFNKILKLNNRIFQNLLSVKNFMKVNFYLTKIGLKTVFYPVFAIGNQSVGTIKLIIKKDMISSGDLKTNALALLKEQLSLPYNYINNDKVSFAAYAALIALGYDQYFKENYEYDYSDKKKKKFVYLKQMYDNFQTYPTDLMSDDVILLVNMVHDVHDFRTFSFDKTPEQFIGDYFERLAGYKDNSFYLRADDINQISEEVERIYRLTGKRIKKLSIASHGQPGMMQASDVSRIFYNNKKKKLTRDNSYEEVLGINEVKFPNKKYIAKNVDLLLISCSALGGDNGRKFGEELLKMFAPNGGTIYGAKVNIKGVSETLNKASLLFKTEQNLEKHYDEHILNKEKQNSYFDEEEVSKPQTNKLKNMARFLMFGGVDSIKRNYKYRMYTHSLFGIGSHPDLQLINFNPTSN